MSSPRRGVWSRPSPSPRFGAHRVQPRRRNPAPGPTATGHHVDPVSLRELLDRERGKDPQRLVRPLDGDIEEDQSPLPIGDLRVVALRRGPRPERGACDRKRSGAPDRRRRLPRRFRPGPRQGRIWRRSRRSHPQPYHEVGAELAVVGRHLAHVVAARSSPPFELVLHRQLAERARLCGLAIRCVQVLMLVSTARRLRLPWSCARGSWADPSGSSRGRCAAGLALRGLSARSPSLPSIRSRSASTASRRAVAAAKVVADRATRRPGRPCPPPRPWRRPARRKSERARP